jgi:hypothetical protein
MPSRLVVTAVAVAITVGAIAAGAAQTAQPQADYGDPGQLYGALTKQPHTRLTIDGGVIDVVFADGADGLNRARVLDWISTSATAVGGYFGRFPVSHVGLLVIADDGDKIGSGTTYGFGGSAIRIHVGRAAGDEAFHKDWVLVHEMTHLALPGVPRRSNWVLEGNATYVEPIARAQAGQLDPSVVWRWAIEGMPKGEPRVGDQGLDETPTWGRTYWGGATFWLLADVRIRQATHGRLGVQDALRAINRRSGGNTTDWSVDQMMTVGDAAVGVQVLAPLYAEMKSTPVQVDLPGLFARLGVSEVSGAVVFDDTAPQADIRRQITAPPHNAATVL